MKEVSLDDVGVIRFKLGGKHWDVKPPSLGEATALQKRLLETGADENEVMADFLEKVGMPKDVTKKLSVTQLLVVIESLVPEKKT